MDVKWAIWVLVVLVLALIVMALYGYYTGAWESIDAS